MKSPAGIGGDRITAARQRNLGSGDRFLAAGIDDDAAHRMRWLQSNDRLGDRRHAQIMSLFFRRESLRGDLQPDRASRPVILREFPLVVGDQFAIGPHNGDFRLRDRLVRFRRDHFPAEFGRTSQFERNFCFPVGAGFTLLFHRLISIRHHTDARLTGDHVFEAEPAVGIGLL